MPTLRLATLLLAAASLTLHAQEPAITLDTPASTEQLHAWLHSDNPRLVAWAATLARTNHNAAILHEIAPLIEHWSFTQVITNNATQADSRHALLTLLDALIQEQEDVPLSTVRAIDKQFPAQALLLTHSRPLSETRSLLDDWTLGPNVGYSPVLQRVAVMLLAKDPRGSQTVVDLSDSTRAFTSLVAAIVVRSQQTLNIHVVHPLSGLGDSVGFGSTCGDSFGAPPQRGWPHVYDYDLAENPAAGDGVTLVDLANDRITATRFDTDGGWGSCSGVQPLNAITRHRLIAYWLGIPRETMPWQPVSEERLIWKDQTTFERELGALIAAHSALLRQTSVQLQAAGYLQQDEVDTIVPRLLVHLDCDPGTCKP